jgi:hypothetical protein
MVEKMVEKSVIERSALENPRMFRFKDASIFAAWIGGLLLIGGLCWFLSAPLRSQLLMKAVNRVFARNGDSRRLDAPIPFADLKPEALRMGSWYTMAFSGEGSRAVVFTLIAEGQSFPCVAELNREGRVEEIIPLSGHGENIFGSLSPGNIQIYISRIEGSIERSIEEAEGGAP